MGPPLLGPALQNVAREPTCHERRSHHQAYLVCVSPMVGSRCRVGNGSGRDRSNVEEYPTCLLLRGDVRLARRICVWEQGTREVRRLISFVSIGEPETRESANQLDSPAFRFLIEQHAAQGRPFRLSNLYSELGRRFAPGKDISGSFKAQVNSMGYSMSRAKISGRDGSPIDWQVTINETNRI